MFKSRLLSIGFLALAVFCADVAGQTTGKDPVIIIPGVSGSEIVNSRTGKAVWFSARRDKTDDLRLPISSANLALNRDGLRAGDIIRKIDIPVLPDVEVYQKLIDALIEKGYTEGDWKKPKATDVFYVFAYDWRRDNVETARLLMQKMAAVKKTLRKPNLKFDILAHSMGGLVARYAAMYGTADLPRDGVSPVPTWAGAVHINKLMMFGTPNEGSAKSIDALLNGYPIIASRKLPFVDDLRPEDVMANPAVFQVLPHQSSARFLDENLQPIKVDLYDPKTWETYGWGAINDPKFLAKLRGGHKSALSEKELKELNDPLKQNADDRLIARTTVAQARAYFASALNRAKRFHQALDATAKTTTVRLFVYGGNCEPTLDALVLIRDEKNGTWTTLADAKDIKTADGKEYKKAEVKAAMFTLGDGTVTARSLLTADPSNKPGDETAIKPIFAPTSSLFGCTSHTKLFLDKPIQDSFLSALVVTEQKQP
ncbi:MAG: hypothetical protein ABL952_09625 [Pyrinomonadaceae bacterium]